jgi:hypothetical protein
MPPDAAADWAAMPTETEIYILPTGEIVVADLPAELAEQLAQLTRVNLPKETTTPVNDSDYVSNQQHSTHPAQSG